jgi:hypothetical protein
LKDMILTVMSCFDEQALWYDEEGFLEVDFDLYYAICERENPNCDYWKIKY